MAIENPIQSYVLVVGAAGIDSKGRANSPLTLGTSTAGSVRISVGGVARNIAENLSRLGTKTVLISALGKGSSGKRILANAAEVGIDTQHCLILDKYRTSAYLAVLDERGNLVMSVDDMDILSCLTPRFINQKRDLVKNAAMVILDSNLPKETITALIKVAQRYKVPVCADPTSVSLAAKLKPMLAEIYMITPNVAEAQILCNCPINDENEAMTAARYLVSEGVEIALITLAEEGVVYATANSSGHIPAVATEIVDSTGASDAMTATIVFGLLNDIPIDEAVRLAASAAALTLACTDTVCQDLSLELLYDHLLI
jgi:pseudouridine kinase